MNPTRISPVIDGVSSRSRHSLESQAGLLDSIYSEGSPSRFFEPLKGILFGLMYVLSGRIQASVSAMALTTCVEALQLSSFAFDAVAFPSWNTQLVGSLASIFSALNLGFVSTTSNGSSFWLVIITVVSFIAITVLASAAVGQSVYVRRASFPSAFWVLRVVIKGLTGVFYLPVVRNLLLVFSCREDGKHSVDDKVQCWKGKLHEKSSSQTLLLFSYLAANPLLTSSPLPEPPPPPPHFSSLRQQVTTWRF